MTTLIVLFALLALASALTVAVWFSASKLRSALHETGDRESAPRRVQRYADIMFYASSAAAALAALGALFGVASFTTAPGATMPTMLLITAAVALLGAVGIREYYKLLGPRAPSLEAAQ